ncbi:DNA-binding protein [Escherichia coli]
MYALKPMGIPGKAPAHVKAWTQQEDDLLITLYPTHTSQEIGAQINRTAASVRNRISALHKQGRVKLKAGRLSRGQIDHIIRHRHTKSAQQLAQELGCCEDSVTRIIRNHGVTLVKCGEAHHKAKYSDAQAKQVRELRNVRKWSWQRIASHMNYLHQTNMTISGAVALYRRRTASDAVFRELLPD